MQETNPGYSTAIHESGHAVSACLLGIPINYVTVIPTDRQEFDDNGCNRKITYPGHLRNSQCFLNVITSTMWRNTSYDYLDIINAYIISTCAGNVAELLEFKYSPRFVDSPDYRQSRDILSIALNEKNPDISISKLYEKTKILLKGNMPIIKTLAKKLMIKGTLNGNECLVLMALHRGLSVSDIQQNLLLQIHPWPIK